MAFSTTYDTATPAGSDDPAEGDDRIREVKAAVQERLNVEHVFDLDGTEVSGANTGKHTNITATSVTNSGNNSCVDNAVSGNEIVGGNATIGGTLGVAGVATVGDKSKNATSAAPDADAQLANKKYVDDIVAALVTTVTGDSDSNTDSPITIGNIKIAWGTSASIPFHTSLNVAHGLTKCFTAWSGAISGADDFAEITVTSIDDTNITLQNTDGGLASAARWFALGR